MSNILRSTIGLIILGVFLYFTFFASNYGSKVNNGVIEVYYRDGATKEEAERVAAFLVKQWAEATDKRSVQIVKDGNTPVFRMVVKKEFQNNNSMLSQLGFLGARMSRDVFNGEPIILEACDEYLKTVKPIPIPANFRHGIQRGKFEVFYAEGVPMEDVEKIFKFIEVVFANSQVPTITATLHKVDTTRVITMPFKPEFINGEEFIAEIRGYCAALSKNEFQGEPVEIAASDESFNVLKVFKP